MYVLNAVSNSWEYYAESDGECWWNVARYSTVWANIDILNTNGAVYLAASAPVPSGAFTITSYDPITTEFKAKGWRRLSYHTTGEQAGTWTYDDFTDTESGGWNYLKNIRSCTREKLYYKGVEVWPKCPKTWSYNGVELPALPAYDTAKYPYAVIFHSSTTTSLILMSGSSLDVATLSYIPEDVKVYNPGANGWVEDVTIPTASWVVVKYLVWSNFNLVSTDTATIFLAASTPIPV